MKPNRLITTPGYASGVESLDAVSRLGTVFTWCWSRSAPHLTKRILSPPRFGQPAYLFITHGQISRTGKWMAVLGMSVGFVICQIVSSPGWQVSGGLILLLSLVAIWLWQRPEPHSQEGQQQLS